MTSNPTYTQDITINGVCCRLTIAAENSGEKYRLRLEPVIPDGADAETARPLLAETAGVDKRSGWLIPGPLDAVLLTNLQETLEHNWKRETLPSKNEPKDLDKVIKEIVDYQLGFVCEALDKAGLPAAAMPFFRDFAGGAFEIAARFMIDQFWKKKKGSNA